MNKMEGLLAGKVALVTGGGAGIGEAICKVFAQEGASVVVNGLPGDAVDDVVAEIERAGGSAIGHVADIATEEGARGCVEAARSGFGRLDVLVANAGLFPELREVDDFPTERFEELLHSNIRGVFHAVRAALPALRETCGCIIGAASEAATHGVPQGASYSATKGWVQAFIRAVAVEQAKYGVRANVVAPGPIDTEMTRPGKGEMNRKTAFMAVKSVPLGRRGTPEEVANVYLFLASDLASYVTGAVYAVDGGSTAGGGMPGLEAKKDAKTAPEGSVELEHQYEGRGTLTK